MGWATEYMTKTATLNPLSWGAQASNWMDRATSAHLPVGKLKIPAGMLALGAGGALIGAMGHGSGQDAVKRKLEEAGSTPEEIARADYLARGPKSGYGAGNAVSSGLAGIGAGIGTNMLLQKATGMTPGMARPLGLAAGLGAAYLASKRRAEGDERQRMKGMAY